MTSLLIDKELQEFVNYLTQPTRIEILSELFESGRPMYITEIATNIKKPARNTSFHLMKLADKGLVKGTYRELTLDPKKPGYGRPAKFYELTPEGIECIKKLEKIF